MPPVILKSVPKEKTLVVIDALGGILLAPDGPVIEAIDLDAAPVGPVIDLS